MNAPEGITVQYDAPLAPHSAWRTGGLCPAFVVVHERAALGPALAWARSEWGRVTVLGAGTRTIFRDGGLKGAVLRLGSGFASVTRMDDVVVAGAAVPVPAVVTAALDWGMAGLESEIGTAGSLGAALALDPGPGGGWGAIVDQISFLYRGRERSAPLAELPKSAIITEVRFRLSLDDGAARRAALEVLRRGPRSPWFDRTSRVRPREELRRVALSGARLRAVVMPEQSPELLVNVGGATAADFSLLHRSALERVEKRRGVKLSSCIRWVGKNI